MKRKSKTVIFFVCIILISFLLLKKRNIREKFQDNSKYYEKTSGTCNTENMPMDVRDCIDAASPKKIYVLNEKSIPGKCIHQKENGLILYNKESTDVECSEEFPCICSNKKEPTEYSEMYYKAISGKCNENEISKLELDDCRPAFLQDEIPTVKDSSLPSKCIQKPNGEFIYNKESTDVPCSLDNACLCRIKGTDKSENDRGSPDRENIYLEDWVDPQQKKHMEDLVREYNIEDMKKWEKEHKMYIMDKDPITQFLCDLAASMIINKYFIGIAIFYFVLFLLCALYTHLSSKPSSILLSIPPILWFIHLFIYLFMTIIAVLDKKISPSVDYYNSELRQNNQLTKTAKGLILGSIVFSAITVVLIIIVMISS